MKVGITFSTFDLFHAGHVKMLEEAKRQCDYLIVGLQLDPSIDRPEKNLPSQSIIERYIQLKGSVSYISKSEIGEKANEIASPTNPFPMTPTLNFFIRILSYFFYLISILIRLRQKSHNLLCKSNIFLIDIKLRKWLEIFVLKTCLKQKN